MLRPLTSVRTLLSPRLLLSSRQPHPLLALTSSSRSCPAGLVNVLPKSIRRIGQQSPFIQPPNPQPQFPDYDGEEGLKKEKKKKGGIVNSLIDNPAFGAAATTVIGLALVFSAGIAYLAWYKYIVLRRMEKAFEPGYDPALDLSESSYKRRHQAYKHTLAPEEEPDHITREEQPLVDRIVGGKEAGSYFMLIGSKGTGKSTMLLDAMRDIQADGAAFVEAHPDLEVFRLRFGKALNFDYHEDSQAALFSRAEPREAGPSLDIERAFFKLEKVALKYTRRRGRPLVIVLNNCHLFPNDEMGHSLLHQLQQRAEGWAEAGIVTMVFSTDDFWPYSVLRKNSSRMKILTVYDLPQEQAVLALKQMRRQFHPDAESPSKGVLEMIYSLVGGRTSFLSKVARAKDMLAEANWMVTSEKEWLMSQIGLIPDVDDDCMDEQKWCSCSWLLLRELAQQTSPLELVHRIEDDETSEPDINGETALPLVPVIDADEQEKGEKQEEVIDLDSNAETAEKEERDMPGYVTFGKARQLMTRGDFMAQLDHLNIISIDTNHHVRPDSQVTLSAIRQIVGEEGFDELLDGVRDRVDEIESLHRTSEWMLKEPVSVQFEQRGKSFRLTGLGGGGGDDEDEGKREGETSGGGRGWFGGLLR